MLVCDVVCGVLWCFVVVCGVLWCLVPPVKTKGPISSSFTMHTVIKKKKNSHDRTHLGMVMHLKSKKFVCKTSNSSSKMTFCLF